VLVFRVESL